MPKVKTVLLFNQQERDAAQLITGFLADIKEAHTPSPTAESSSPAFTFTHAIFSRNDLTPPDISSSSNSAEAAEPERDLSVPNAAAAALRASSPTTSTRVLDNVADAVAEARALATRDGNGGGERTMVLVTGSLHLVGALLRTLEPEAED